MTGPSVRRDPGHRRLQAGSATLEHAVQQWRAGRDRHLPPAGRYRLEFALTPRPRDTLATYPEYWPADRFEILGDIFLVPPGMALRLRSGTSGNLPSLTCLLPPGEVEVWDQQAPPWNDARLLACLNVQDVIIRGLLLRLEAETGQRDRDWKRMSELICAQLAIEVGRYLLAAVEEPTPGGLAPWRLRLIDERLQANPRAPSVAELAQLCQLSVRQLRRGFHTSRGCSIGDYVANCRTEHAKRLLLADSPVKSVAYALGFSSPSGFCHAFRRATGVTPNRFRQVGRLEQSADADHTSHSDGPSLSQL